MSAAVCKLARVTAYPKEYTAMIEAEYRKRVKRAAEVVRQKIRQNIGLSGNGRPSKEGEYPRKQSGEMYRGVKTKQTKRSPFTFRVFNTAKHAEHMEFGVRGGKVIAPKNGKVLTWHSWSGKGKTKKFAAKVVQGEIKPRTFMRRTLLENREVIKKIFLRKMAPLTGGKRGTVRIG